MSIITLTTDLGNKDYSVSAIKGIILQNFAEAKIVDISNEIKHHDLLEASYVLKNAYSFFPKNTVHIIGVDCLYHKTRKALIFKAHHQFFISADNGICNLLFPNIVLDVFEISLNNRFEDVNSYLLDIFAPVAANLANGVLPEVIGKKTEKYLQKKTVSAKVNETIGLITGEVIYVDHFGNVVSNITKEDFSRLQLIFNHYEISFRGINLNKVQKSLSSFIPNWESENHYDSKNFCVFNSQNLLEIRVYKGTSASGASSLFGLDVGEKIYINFNV